MKHLLVGYDIGRTVSAVVHDQCAVLHLLLDELCHFGVAEARRRRLSLVGIPVNLLDAQLGVLFGYLCGDGVGVAHVAVAVTVVAHHADCVLPRSGVVVSYIADNLVHHHLGLFRSPCRQSSHGDVALVGDQQTAPLIVVQKAVVVIGEITVGLTE